MASSWRSAQAPVLDLGRPTGDVRYGRREAVLWPVWVWNAVAPDTTTRRLDVLERTALGYASLGVDDTARISSRLGLERDLIAKVWASLIARGYLDANDRPTKSGKEALRELRDSRANLVSGAVVVDAHGDLPLALLTGEVPQLPAKWVDGYPVLDIGTPGRPEQTLRPFTVDCERSSVQPKAFAVAQLATSARRRRGAGELETLGEAELVRFAAQVSFVGEPRRAFLWIEVITEELLPDCLAVRLPRGSSSLGRRFLPVLEQVRRDHGSLNRKIQQLIGEAAADDASTGRTDGRILQLAAQARIRARLGPELETYPEVLEQLVALDRKSDALQRTADPHRDSVEDVIIAAQKSVEAACEALRPKSFDRRRWPWEKEARANAAATFLRIAAAARICGFDVPSAGTPESERLGSVAPGKLFSAIMFGGGSLLPKVLSLIVLGTVDSSHPIREAARLAPRLLFDLVELDRYRNPASHGGRRVERGDAAPNPDDARRLHGIAEAAVAALLGIDGVRSTQRGIA